MRRWTVLLFCLGLIAPLAGCGDDGTGDPGGELHDTDRDGITDVQEGRRDQIDTDLDGIPDFRDDDSDGDGIPDRDEAGDDDLETPPIDSDSDTIPDFMDTDSDDNGIPDAVEGTGDAEGDGIPDYRDTDDDDDYVPDGLELGGIFNPPQDTDGDGLPNYRDPDSDNDNILDGHERGIDTDMDGLGDWEDLDTDNDGISDVDEAGDLDIRTSPVDTDGDGTPDFRDPDSDNDGLSDSDEITIYGTDPRNQDSDGDGVTDLIEVVGGADPLDRLDSPRTRGDFVFVVPFEEDPAPPRDTLEFQTSLQFADLYFNFDESGSMSEELRAMKDPVTGVPGIINQLRCEESTTTCADVRDCPGGEVCNRSGRCAVDPRVGDCIPDIWTGIGTFQDIDKYRNILSLQSDPVITAGAVPSTGGGSSEAPYQAPACVADGANCTNSDINCVPDGTGIGCPGFRESAVRIYIQITDADDQCSGARCAMFTPEFAGAELVRMGIKFVGLAGEADPSNDEPPENVARRIALAAGTVNSDGEPYVYRAIDAAVVEQTVHAIRALVNADNFRVTIDATDEPDDAGDALQFIDHLEINTSGGDCTPIVGTEDTNGDTFDDAFTSLQPGTPVCWDVVAKRNDAVMPARIPLIFRAKLTVRADGSEVDSRVIYFLVPPDITIDIPM